MFWSRTASEDEQYANARRAMVELQPRRRGSRDGSKGLPQYAPYNAISVSAAAPSVPQSLIEQLHEGGRMVIPVGPPHAQELQLVRKLDGRPITQVIEGCRFVPLIGAQGY